MKYLLIFAALFSFKLTALDRKAPNATREPGRSYTEYLTPRVMFENHRWGDSVEAQASSYTEEEFKEKADRVEFEEYDYESFREAYQWIRDERFLSSASHPDFKRRITWQYPDDGCFARAELALRKLKSKDFKGLKKIFVFGDLQADTPNAKEGLVTWWFHVAPIVKVNGEYFVIDPAISPSRTISVKEWIESMNRDFDSVKISVCDETSYDPGSRCTAAEEVTEEEVMGHQTSFLHREWFRAVELGRDPEIVLGDYPPWGEVFFQGQLR